MQRGGSGQAKVLIPFFHPILLKGIPGFVGLCCGFLGFVWAGLSWDPLGSFGFSFWVSLRKGSRPRSSGAREHGSMKVPNMWGVNLEYIVEAAGKNSTGIQTKLAIGARDAGNELE